MATHATHTHGRARHPHAWPRALMSRVGSVALWLCGSVAVMCKERGARLAPLPLPERSEHRCLRLLANVGSQESNVGVAAIGKDGGQLL